MQGEQSCRWNRQQQHQRPRGCRQAGVRRRCCVRLGSRHRHALGLLQMFVTFSVMLFMCLMSDQLSSACLCVQQAARARRGRVCSACPTTACMTSIHDRAAHRSGTGCRARLRASASPHCKDVWRMDKRLASKACPQQSAKAVAQTPTSAAYSAARRALISAALPLGPEGRRRRRRFDSPSAPLPAATCAAAVTPGSGRCGRGGLELSSCTMTGSFRSWSISGSRCRSQPP